MIRITSVALASRLARRVLREAMSPSDLYTKTAPAALRIFDTFKTSFDAVRVAFGNDEGCKLSYSVTLASKACKKYKTRNA